MHYYLFNIGDYKSHTEHLTEIEDLAYRRLLDWYYLHECPIPADIDEAARQIRMRSHTECIASVLREFFECTENGWVSHRADKEIAKVGDKSEKASASAKARWDKKKQPKDANALPPQSESNATQDTRHNTQGEAAPQPTRPAKKVTLTTYMANCKAAGTKPIPDNHFVREYAKDAGIADEMLQVNWEAFKARYLAEKKLYSDWPKVFAASVKERWFKLWFPGDEGLAVWTSTGLQEKQVLEKRMKEAK